FFEIVNDCVEAFFSDEIGWPFEEMHRGDERGVPTVKVEATFPAPSVHGDRLILTLEITRLGRTSLSLAIVARCAEEVRMQVAMTIVHIDAAGRPAPWPEAHLPKLRAHLREGADVL